MTAPILVILTLLGITSVAIFNYKTPEPLKETPLPIPTPLASPSPELTPTPKPSILPDPSPSPVLKTIPRVIPEPSRSPERKIVSHFDWCNRKDISVYEDELVEYKGQKVTKDDIKCIEAATGGNSQPKSKSKADCENQVQAWYSSQLYSCRFQRNPTTCEFALGQQRSGYLSNCN